MSTSWSRDDFATVAKQNAGGEKGRAIEYVQYFTREDNLRAQPQLDLHLNRD